MQNTSLFFNHHLPYPTTKLQRIKRYPKQVWENYRFCRKSGNDVMAVDVCVWSYLVCVIMTHWRTKIDMWLTPNIKTLTSPSCSENLCLNGDNRNLLFQNDITNNASYISNSLPDQSMTKCDQNDKCNKFFSHKSLKFIWRPSICLIEKHLLS